MSRDTRAGRRRLIAPILFGTIGAAILVSLGVWQLQRLTWKEGVLAEIAARKDASPVPVPAAPTEAAHEYLRVREEGRVAPEALHVLVSIQRQGPGYRVIAPFTLDDGRRVLLDRGFLPQAEKDRPLPTGRLSVTGTLLWPDERDSFTPDPDLTGNVWFVRDAVAMAEVLQTAPVMIVSDAPVPDGAPEPLPVTVAIPNNHLEYALTWFSLAIVWLAMTAYLVVRLRTKAQPAEN
ncbi:MAG: SURF1 family protein [Pseudomonadota bacterium]